MSHSFQQQTLIINFIKLTGNLTRKVRYRSVRSENRASPGGSLRSQHFIVNQSNVVKTISNRMPSQAEKHHVGQGT